MYDADALIINISPQQGAKMWIAYVVVALIGATILLAIINTPDEYTVSRFSQFRGTALIGFTAPYVHFTLRNDRGKERHFEGWKIDYENIYEGRKVLFYPFSGSIKILR